VLARSGNTKEPDDTWSSFSPPLVEGGIPEIPLGRYLQLKVLLSPSRGSIPTLVAMRAAYLVENRPPEIVRIDVVAPGWKVSQGQREQSESRSVTFNEAPFKKHLDRFGAQLPTLQDRPSGKQTLDVGYRTVYAYVEDPDQDALRYRFFLGPTDELGRVSTWEEIKEWSEEPFVSFEASRIADGSYRVRVEVDDSLTNGPLRALSESEESAPFVVVHAPPVFQSATADPHKEGARVQLRVKSALPLAHVRCSVGAAEWSALDSVDGIVDSRTERFDVVVRGDKKVKNVSCRALDEGLNETRVDIPISKP
jgi:hypothetical protein